MTLWLKCHHSVTCDFISDVIIFALALLWPQTPCKARKNKRNEDSGKQVDTIVVQDWFSTDSLCGCRFVTDDFSDAGIEAWGQKESDIITLF